MARRDGTRPFVLLAMRPDLPPRLFGASARDRLNQVADVDLDLVGDDFEAPAVQGALASADVLLTGWGCPVVDAGVLARAPRLGAVVHAAGSVKGHVAPVCWDRGIVVSTAAGVNAQPVAEFALAAILLAGKRTWTYAHQFSQERRNLDHVLDAGIGNYERTVGVVGASRIGRRLLRLLRPFDVEVLLCDPYVEPTEATTLGARLVAIDELMASSDAVTLHAPAVPATRHLVDARRLGLMRDGATLVNTARGSLVDTDALIPQVVSGRIFAVLDVTDPEPLPADSPLWDAPSCLLTPHLAGSAGTELLRMGEHAVDEVARYAAGLPFTTPVLLEDLDRMA